jgi:hypothetical protein
LGWRLASSFGEHSQQPCRRRGCFQSEVSNGGGGGTGALCTGFTLVYNKKRNPKLCLLFQSKQWQNVSQKQFTGPWW